jgi:hypothetical protein
VQVLSTGFRQPVRSRKRYSRDSMLPASHSRSIADPTTGVRNRICLLASWTKLKTRPDISPRTISVNYSNSTLTLFVTRTIPTNVSDAETGNSISKLLPCFTGTLARESLFRLIRLDRCGNDTNEGVGGTISRILNLAKCTMISFVPNWANRKSHSCFSISPTSPDLSWNRSIELVEFCSILFMLLGCSIPYISLSSDLHRHLSRTSSLENECMLSTHFPR